MRISGQLEVPVPNTGQQHVVEPADRARRVAVAHRLVDRVVVDAVEDGVDSSSSESMPSSSSSPEIQA